MNPTCEFCKKIRDMGAKSQCRPCWRAVNVVVKKMKKGKKK